MKISRLTFTILLVVVSLITLILISFYQSSAINNELERLDDLPDTKIMTPPAPELLSTTIDITFFGDILLTRRLHNWAMASDLKYAYPFSGLGTFGKNSTDNWIGNLECPVTNAPITQYEEEELLKFNCKPEYLPEAAKWFEVFSLSNNHTDNMEEVDGLTQTRSYLEQNEIQYFGHYDNAVKEDICEIVTLKAVNIYKKQNGETFEKESNLPIALCGFHSVFNLSTDEEIATISQYAKYLPTFVMPHQGTEYETTSDGLKQITFRKMIDSGADSVMGGHPHTVQETEAYNGKLIVYSLGNFIFDQQGSPLVTQGIAIKTKLKFEDLSQIAFLETIGEDCRKYKDDCLQRLANETYVKPTYSLDYELIATNSDNQLTKKGSEIDYQQMLTRTNFLQTINSLR